MAKLGKSYYLKVEVSGEAMSDLTLYEYVLLCVNQASKSHRFQIEKVEKHQCAQQDE